MGCVLLLSYIIYLAISIMMFAGAGILSTLVVPKIDINSYLIGLLTIVLHQYMIIYHQVFKQS